MLCDPAFRESLTEAEVQHLIVVIGKAVQELGSDSYIQERVAAEVTKHAIQLAERHMSQSHQHAEDEGGVSGLLGTVASWWKAPTASSGTESISFDLRNSTLIKSQRPPQQMQFAAPIATFGKGLFADRPPPLPPPADCHT